MILKSKAPDLGQFPISRLHCLYPVHNPEFLQVVKESIKEDGLDNPIVIQAITVQEWSELKSSQTALEAPPSWLDPEDMVVVVRCGNNRVRAAEALGYDGISYIVATSAEEASELCGRQRNSGRK